MKLLGRSDSLQSVVSNLDLVLFEAQNRCQCIGQRLLVINYQNPCHVALQIGEDSASPTQDSISDCRACPQTAKCATICNVRSYSHTSAASRSRAPIACDC